MAQKVWDGDRGKFAAVALCFDVGSSSFSGSYSSFFPSRRGHRPLVTLFNHVDAKIIDSDIVPQLSGLDPVIDDSTPVRRGFSRAQHRPTSMESRHAESGAKNEGAKVFSLF